MSEKYDFKAVGERIRRRRNELKLSQAELAEKIERAPKFCADIERGYCGMSIDTMLAFCRALSVTPSTLLLGEATACADPSDTMNQIMEILAECTEEQRRSVLEMLRLFTVMR